MSLSSGDRSRTTMATLPFSNLFRGAGDFGEGGEKGVQVIFNRVEFAVIGIGDLGRQVAFADAFHISSGDIEGSMTALSV